MFRSKALIFSSAVPQCGPPAVSNGSLLFPDSLNQSLNQSLLHQGLLNQSLLLAPYLAMQRPMSGDSPMMVTTPSTSRGSPSSGTMLKGDRCVGCGSDSSIRVHYGASSCHGCKAFFRRSVFEGRVYMCSAENNCDITNESRNRCRACRLRNCLEGGMNPKHVREERSKIERMPNANSESTASDQERIVEESQLTQFICGLERQTELLTDDDVNGSPDMVEWSRDITLTFGLQNPRLVIKRTTTEWECQRIMNSEDLYSAWYRAFVLHADWAMGVPDFRVMPLADQTLLFKQNFMSFGWITYAYKCYEQNNDSVGIPLGNGSFIPYDDSEQARMDPKWVGTYGLVGKKLIDLIVKPMRTLEMTSEEYCLLKCISLFQTDCPLSDMARNTCVRMCDRLLEALFTHIERRFPQLSPAQRFQRGSRIMLLLPSFNTIGQIESSMIQNLPPFDINELSGVPLEILNSHRPNGSQLP